MFLGGVAWMVVANSLSISAQLALPDWLRARGMSMYQMAIMGGSALGAAFWGQVAYFLGVRWSVGLAAVSGALVMLLAQRLLKDRDLLDDPSPALQRQWPVPSTPHPPPSGRIMVQIDYRIDPARQADFEALMVQSRRSRLRMGALSWELLHDLEDPGHYTEQVIDASWTEHLRRFERVSAADVALRERKLAFHLGDEPPQVRRYLLGLDSRTPLDP
jgi:hypothetical protein